MTDKTQAFFMKLDSGQWGVRVMGPAPEPGDVVTVVKRGGEEKQVTVTEVIELVNGQAICAFTDGSAPDRPAPAARKPRTFEPTGEQAHALKLFREGGSIAIQAGAGTGKTSTLILLAEDAHDRGLRGQYVAFNNKIVAETSGKFPGSVDCNTAHSLAYRAVGTHFSRRMKSGARMKSHDLAVVLELDPINVTNWMNEKKRLSPTFLAGHVIKAALRFCQTADPEPTYRHFPLIDNLDAPPSPERPTSYAINNQVARALEPALKRAWSDLCMFEGKLPFTLSTAMAVILKLWQLDRPRINADYILWDEAQDASPVMIDVIRQQAHAQVIWVGDSNQQIYAFTGAINALDDVPADSTAMLTQSFRFGPAIANIANEILRCLPTNMRIVGTEEVPSRVVPVAAPRAILSRTNAAAIRAVMTAAANEQSAHLVGGSAEIALFCRAARDLQAGRRTDHPELGCFESWVEVQEYVTHDQQGDDLRLMVGLIDEFGVQVILDAVNGTGNEEDADVIVSTAHKSKGCEWDSVQLAGDFPERAKMNADELRLLYVACTRAKVELDLAAVAFFNPEGAELSGRIA
jgi:hypothetical protein